MMKPENESRDGDLIMGEGNAVAVTYPVPDDMTVLWIRPPTRCPGKESAIRGSDRCQSSDASLYQRNEQSDQMDGTEVSNFRRRV